MLPLAAGEMRLGVGAEGLLAFVVQLAAVLVEELVADVRREQAGQLGNAVVELDEVGAEGIDGVVVGGLGLNAAGRIPTEPVVERS